jgi:hypothetical protein
MKNVGLFDITFSKGINLTVEYKKSSKLKFLRNSDIHIFAKKVCKKIL